MIDQAAVRQILSQYEKHGWILRRVLLSDRLREGSPAILAALPDVEVRTSDLDGLWFSRSSRPDVTAWELRHLSINPYALVQNIDAATGDAETDDILKAVEIRMLDAVSRRSSGH